MSSATLYRASGLALLLGALLGIIGNILNTLSSLAMPPTSI